MFKKMSAPQISKRRQDEQDRWEGVGKYAAKKKPRKSEQQPQRFFSFENGDGETLYFKTRCNPNTNPLCFATLNNHQDDPQTAEELELYGIKPKKVRAPKPKKQKVAETPEQVKARMARVRAAKQAKGATKKQTLEFSDDDE